MARHIINTLKSGVIPDTDLDILCTGRDKVINELGRCLDIIKEGNGCVKFVAGEYGSGKSFILGKLRQLAVKRDFAVCRIQINKSFNLSSFDSFYYNVMHNLTIKASSSDGTDFETIFGSWIGRLKLSYDKNSVYEKINEVIASLENFNSSFARAFLTYIRSRINQDFELSNAAASWIKGEKNIPAVLKAKFDVVGDIDKHTSIDSLKAFTHLLKLLGYNGLVILIDELELLMSLRSDIRKTSFENLRYIIDNSFGGEFRSCMFVFAATDDLFIDEERGIKTYHALYQRLGEYVPGKTNQATDIRQPVLHMTKLDYEELLMLTERIMDIHKVAFNWIPSINSDAARNWALLTLNKEITNKQPVNTREFIKKLIEFLDILEQNRGYNLVNSELKMLKHNTPEIYDNVYRRSSEN
jgi:Protein of unknown function (DUF2791).